MSRWPFAKLCVLILFALLPAMAQTRTPPEFKDWLPISNAESIQSAPLVDKDAGAEILLWRVHVADEILVQEADVRRVFYHYIRIKVLNEKGRTSINTVTLPYTEPDKIIDVAGRTIKADGSTIDVDPKAIYRREVARVGKIKQQVVGFAMPGVEKGSIVEYRWRHIRHSGPSQYLRLNFARELPIQRVTYFVNPLANYLAKADMAMAAFNCRPSPMVVSGDWNETTVEHVPATRNEPDAPAKANMEPWALLYYRPSNTYREPQKFWDEIGKKVFNETKPLIKSNDTLKAAAVKINEQSKTDDEKISAMISWGWNTLKSPISSSASEQEQLAVLKKLLSNGSRNTNDILRSGVAFDYELNRILIALAQQVGYDARVALVADRDEKAFLPDNMLDRYFLNNEAVAIRAGDSWRIVDASHSYLKPGMLPSDMEGVHALVSDPKASVFVQTRVSTPEESAEVRKATLTLSVDGNLTGDVQETYTGHRAASYRDELAGEALADQEAWLRGHTLQRFSGAQISSVTFANIEDATKPLEIHYHLSAPGYAQVTGRRMLVEPVAFRRSDPARFVATERRFPIEFLYGWAESDELRITLPDGFELEEGENPGSLDFGRPGAYLLEMGTTGRDLMILRQLIFGRNELRVFPTSQYPTVKRAFDTVHVHDTTSLSLKAN